MTDSTSAFATRYRIPETLETLGIAPEGPLIDRLARFTALLMRWNRTYNLTGAKSEQALVQEHLIDSLAAVPILEARLGMAADPSPLLVDVGSGAGFPGIVVASVHPDWPLALVEPNGKKAAFLVQAVATLGLRHVHPIADRLENTAVALAAIEPAPNSPRHFTCRAVASLPDLIRLINPLAKPGSRLLALKSRHLDDELANIQNVSVHSLRVPGLDQQRAVVEVPLTSPHAPQPGAGSPAR